MFDDKSFTKILPVILKLPVITDDPLIREDPVRMRVSTAENVELPDTKSDPFITAPFDAVTDAKCASLPLTISFFQLANYHSSKISDLVHISMPINMNLLPFWSNYKPNLDFCES